MPCVRDNKNDLMPCWDGRLYGYGVCNACRSTVTCDFLQLYSCQLDIMFEAEVVGEDITGREH